jgi:subtilisin family serine protease
MGRRAGLAAIAAVALVGLLPTPPASAAPPKPATHLLRDLAPRGALAVTDPSLLHRAGPGPVSIVVKLDYDPTATYAGDLPGFAATSPAVTGHALTRGAAEQHYQQRIASIEDPFLGALRQRVPGARVGQRLHTVYGGVALTVPADAVDQVLHLPGVVAVQPDTANHLLTADEGPGFIGAAALYRQLGGAPDAGRGVMFGSLDSGVWPEHPMFADTGHLPAPPPRADGAPRTCDFGGSFQCNHKLIGGAAFLDSYAANGNPPDLYGTTARDSEGHGTHTASTAAGDPVTSAPIFGIDRGPINGVAPGAWLSVYKVCGANGCYNGDIVAGIGRALDDGVNVLNYSITGGTNPFGDPVELAFLDAYAAGVFVAASAGNSGPAAGTSDHVSPWVTAVGASTQRREFQSRLTLTAADGTSASFTGASITGGAGPAPLVMASAGPYDDAICAHPAPPGTFTGEIVACARGGIVDGSAISRTTKGYNVLRGGAAGMVLYNPTPMENETDNHFLPTVHLADGTAFLAYVAAHPSVTAAFPAGAAVRGPGDVMASFSARGPAGQFIKPDLTAPGLQVLGGNTPTPDSTASGPAGQYYQAIAGTSMAAPHVAGAAILEKALHPGWTPGQIKSALMTTATTEVVREDGHTPADPFDRGAGRVRVDAAATPGLTFDETVDRMETLGADPVNAVRLNLPSIDAPVMPGRLTAVRTAKNVTDRALTYRAQATAPGGSTITVTPGTFTVAPGASATLDVTITSSAPTGQYFGEVRLVPLARGGPTLHLPVAFVPQQGQVAVSQSCAEARVHPLEPVTCTVTAQNNGFADTTVDFTTSASPNLPLIGAEGASVTGPYTAKKSGVTLRGAVPSTPSLTADPATHRYVPLDSLGAAATPIGDEQLLTFDTPAYTYNGRTYTGISVDSNGYAVPGTDTVLQDNQCCALNGIPDPARPNNVLAPFWTDLDGTGAPGVFVATVARGDASYVVVEWRVNLFGTTSPRVFELWLGTGATQDVAFAYDPGHLPVPAAGQPFQVGAENVAGTGGQGLPPGRAPTEDLVVTSTPAVPGATAAYSVTALGTRPGPGALTTTATTPAVPGTTVVSSPIGVRFEPLADGGAPG